MASTQDLKTEMFLSSWTDISTYVYQRDTVTVQRGRQNEAAQMQPGQATLTLNNRDGRFTTRNPTGAYYPNLVQNTPLRLSVPVADAGLSNYLRLEGDLTSSATTPDSAGLQITGVLDVRVDCWLTDYQPAVLAAKWGGTAKSWMFVLNSAFQNYQPSVNFEGTASLGFYWFDGTNVQGADSGPGIPGFPGFPSAPTVGATPGTGAGGQLPSYGQRLALRVLFTPSTGVTQFYTAATMAGPWTQLGSNVTFGTTTLSNGAGQAVQVGGSITQFTPGFVTYACTFTSCLGMIYEAQVLAAGVVKADPVFSAQTAGATSFTDAQSNTWTLGGTSEISSRLYRYHGEMSSFPKAADPSATDVYSQATAVGVTQRLQGSNTPLQSPMRRAYVRLPSTLNLAAYWPGEDGTVATSIGSALGGTPMTITGSPSLASNSDFVSSAPLPVMKGATFTGTVPSWPGGTDAAVRFMWEVPAGGETDLSIVAAITYTGGTVGYMTVTYRAGGSVSMEAYSAPGGTLIHGTGPIGAIISNGAKVRFAADLKKNGTGVDMTMTSLQPGGTNAPISTFTIASATVGQVTRVQFGSAGITGSVLGHFSAQGTADTIFDLAGPLLAWNGEPAATRIARLCSEEGIACRIIGSQLSSMPMNNQTIDTLMNLLQACEQTDLGMLYEPRQALGLGYRTRSSMYHQTPQCTASYSAAQIYQGFASTGDTQLTVNDVTATAPSGSTARQIQATGRMSTQAPPNGIGTVATQISPSPQLDSALTQLASWHLSVRSVDDDRYPAIPFQMPRTATPSSVALLDVGDYLQITGTPSWLPPPPVRQLAAGFSETWFPAAYWLLNVNGIPELPYETAQIGPSHFDTAGSTLTAGISSGATSFQVTTQAGSQPWTLAAGDFPFDIVIDGEQITVTNITSATSPQTFTVTRSVNGIVKAHLLGAAVALYRKFIWSL